MTVVDTGVSPSTAVTQYEITFVAVSPETGNPAVRVRILSSGGGSVTYERYFETNLPANGTLMAPTMIHSSTGTSSLYDIYFVETMQDA